MATIVPVVLLLGRVLRLGFEARGAVAPLASGSSPISVPELRGLPSGRAGRVIVLVVTSEPSATAASPAKREDMLEKIDNPIEWLKLLSGNDEEISRYLDAIEVTMAT